VDGDVSFRRAPPDRVRRTIAAAILGDTPDATSTSLGTISLWPHQAEAAERLVAMIERDGGAMLAEPVGLGKTYTALAVAARLRAERVVVAIPASLREMWSGATRDTRLLATFVTHEALSRGAAPPPDPQLVIVDESHRFRNPGTKRYATMAGLCARTRVLLVTATPVQNARDDLAAQLALFLGREAWRLSDAEIATHVVRAARRTSELPRVIGPTIVPLAADDDCVDELLALPPPVPARDESTAVGLLIYGLVHQWTSSRAALIAALERRVARGMALASVLETGRRPSRAELAAWTWSPDAVQLAFPEIVAYASIDSGQDIPGLLAAVLAHQTAIASLVQRLRRAPNPDDDRAAALRAIRASHPGERVIAFCHYGETVRALWSRLARDAGVAALTGVGARVASGRVSRASVLEQFTPRGTNARDTPRAERIDLLIATDVLSEGLNLHEASVVVHLDYPWNPARLDQRVGRVRRLASRHEAVTVYALAPPASGERLLRIDERLRDKLRAAERTVGVAGRILPSPIPTAILASDTEEDHRGAAELASEIRARLKHWLDDETSCGPIEAAHVDATIATVRGATSGVIALVAHGTDARLAVDVGGGFDASPPAILRALDASTPDEVNVDDAGIAATVQRLERWLDARFGALAVELPTASASRTRRAALARVARTLSRTPRHRQALLAPLAHAARSVAVAPLAEGAERVLDSLVQSDLPDEAWLRSIAAFGELNVRPDAAHRRIAERGRVVAVLLLVGPHAP
jgi:superfamily II DNA or RNA helicase